MALKSAKTRSAVGFNPDPDHAVTLPSSYYWDGEIYAREREEIWFKTWQFVGHARDVAQPGDFLTADILDHKILVTRGKDDVLRAFYNV